MAGFIDIKQGRKEIIPSPHKGEDTAGYNSRFDQRDHDPCKDAAVGTAVDLCCFVQFDRNTADEVGKQVYEKSLDREEVWDSQGKERTDPA